MVARISEPSTRLLLFSSNKFVWIVSTSDAKDIIEQELLEIGMK